MEYQSHHPVQTSDRLIAIDLIRGVALLGILIMNIQAFAMTFSAYSNPTVYGDLTGVNYYVYYFSHVFANQKFMTIFSLLFGCSIILMADHIVKKGGNASKIHYKRMFILAVVGLAHAYLLWFGDILFPYAIAGTFAYLGRNLSAKSLFISGFILISLSSLLMWFAGFSLPYWEQADLDAVKVLWMPTYEFIQQDLLNNRGSWLEQMDARRIMAAKMQTNIIFYIPRILGLMFVGIALYKINFFGQRFSTKSLLIAGGVSFILSTIAIVVELEQNFALNWKFELMFLGIQHNYWGSILMAFSYMCFLLVFSRCNILVLLQKALANVGRMALTNYLSHTIICCIIFYGWGFGLYGSLERIEQFAVVLAIWLFQLVFSTYWLKHYRFGPFEWVMRSLTYNSLQPLKK
ncbi:DUF418 domain-containing protein [Thalassotalea sp. 1_MG-2023]|uniref:DUF418 domain-containing protein n=1 Tax=Thalassotalea sp. 1_MG-2023 TaxID=3062680 RepID=UPI0026E38C6D|nr:DUF418 domain-containing protein [Thalassotalea sp. 1_MG-2023]MDO6427334.1 DUF418 domain-containing protein [Thalassotalea sp. 1_MG-2023]